MDARETVWTNEALEARWDEVERLVVGALGKWDGSTTDVFGSENGDEEWLTAMAVSWTNRRGEEGYGLGDVTVGTAAQAAAWLVSQALHEVHAHLSVVAADALGAMSVSEVLEEV